MTRALGYAAQQPAAALETFTFDRRALRPDDVSIRITYCGVCHTDLHQVRNDWHGSQFPMVPGHEIVGEVIAVGEKVSRFAPGDRVAVGCMVDSCGVCDQCGKGEEQFCRTGPTLTYNGHDRHDGTPTFGGYSDHIVVPDGFVLRLPDGLDAERAAPLLCAGITTYSPLRAWGVKRGSRVAVAGLGGLGHVAVKLAAGMDAEVTVITSSSSKEADARALGAHNVLLSSDGQAMVAAGGSFDLIIDTVPVEHDLAPFVSLLDIDGTLVLVGAIGMIPSFHSGLLLGGRRRIASSPIGGIAETQEMLDFCADKNILPETETIAIQDINHAFERMERSDVRYRFVVDMSTLERERGAP